MNLSIRLAEPTTLFEVVDDGEALPRLEPTGRSFVVKNIYADFKRHDLGPAFHEREYDGTYVTEFMTEPLWGVGTSAPYGHDRRSINLEEVILRHGGEAEASRNAFAALNDNNQRKLIEFLDTLILFPPADTASNLNPGLPGSSNPQDPSQHGSIDLSVLFQDAYEGRE
ncbi:MAG: di-heme oxidoredictase family protein [Woeseia sp.]